MANTRKPARWPAPRRSARFLLLGLILLAFARLTWQLDAKALWLDETFSLQRAESPWPELIAGCLPLTDGVTWVKTTDQHPFAYFVFLGLAVRLLGQSEFALRFPSVIAATLVVPLIWAFGRRLARSKSVPPPTAFWAALLAALNPFYLWFGQETRMYAQVGLLALLSAYLLLRWADAATPAVRRRWLAGYGLALFLLLASHYFALLILPAQALVVLVTLRRRHRLLALLATAGLIALALAPGSIALWLLARDQAAGSNWARIAPAVLLPDLVNAFSLGLSVNLAQVWPLDVLYAALALLGVFHGLARWRRAAAPSGWLLPSLLIVPPALLLLINTLRPAYMTARHMSLVSAFFILLAAAGLARIWQARRWAAVLLAAVLAAASGYSTVRYFVLPEYDKGEHVEMGRYLAERVQEGDLILFRPLPWGRLFRYYFPTDALGQAELAGRRVSWRVLPTDLPEKPPPPAPAAPASPQVTAASALDRLVLGVFGTQGWYECPLPPSPVANRPAELARPLFLPSRDALIGELDALTTRYRRIWLARADGDDPVSEWLRTRSFHADGRAFASPLASLRLDLFLAESPVRDRPPTEIEHPVEVVFGDQVRLVGYDLGQPLMAGGAWPVTLYWQPVAPLARRYKYILGGSAEALHATPGQRQATETEPYNGFLPTPMWPAGAIIVEYTGVPGTAVAAPPLLRPTLQVYDAETLQKLPVVRAVGVQAGPDPFTVVLGPGER